MCYQLLTFYSLNLLIYFKNVVFIRDLSVFAHADCKSNSVHR